MTRRCETQNEKPAERTASGFEEVEHTADVALHFWAPDFENLLVQAALGMAWILSGKMPSGPLPVRKHLTLEAFDMESLLVAWLGELAYTAETDREIYYEFEFERVTDHKLAVVAQGIQVQALNTVIKAVTYHDLKIMETARGFETTVVLDV